MTCSMPTRFACSLGALLLLASPLTTAFVDPPTLDPPQPAAFQEVFVSIRSGVCDFVGEVTRPAVVTVNGLSITMLLDHFQYSGAQCVYLPSTQRIRLGRFAAGNYSVTINTNFFDDGVGGPVLQTLAILPMTVLGGGPAPGPVGVPANHPLALGFLVLLLLLVGITTRRAGRGFFVMLAGVGLSAASLVFSIPAQAQALPPRWAWVGLELAYALNRNWAATLNLETGGSRDRDIVDVGVRYSLD